MAAPPLSPTKTHLTARDVLHVAELARLHLTQDEVERMTTELAAVIGYVEKLAELDTQKVAPTAHVHCGTTPLRTDTPREGLSQEVALAEAPRHSQGGFAVPAFVEEG